MTTPKFEHSEIEKMLTEISPWPWSFNLQANISNKYGSEIFVSVETDQDGQFIAQSPQIISQLLEEVKGLEEALDARDVVINALSAKVDYYESTVFTEGLSIIPSYGEPTEGVEVKMPDVHKVHRILEHNKLMTKIIQHYAPEASVKLKSSELKDQQIQILKEALTDITESFEDAVYQEFGYENPEEVTYSDQWKMSWTKAREALAKLNQVKGEGE